MKTLLIFSFLVLLSGSGSAQDTVANAATHDHATANEWFEKNVVTVNKAAGNFSGLLYDWTLTSAPGTDNRLIDFVVGGTSVFRVNEAGNAYVAGDLGIGDPTPDAKLDVATPTSGAAIAVGRFASTASIVAGDDASGGKLVLDGVSAGAVSLNEFGTGGVHLALGGGNVGVGTAIPDVLFHVKGVSTTSIGGKIENTSADGFANFSIKSNLGGINFQAIGSTDASLPGFENHGRLTVDSAMAGFDFMTVGASPIAFYTGAVHRMVILGTGNVGIGAEAAPSSRLHVNDSFSGAVTVLTLENGTIIANRPVQQDFVMHSSANANIVFGRLAVNNTVATAGAEDCEMMFSAMLNGTLTEAMRIDDNNNVGIGETNPAAKLDITGALALGDMVAPAAVASHGLLYAVAGEVIVKDSAGNATTISPHPQVIMELVGLSGSAKTLGMDYTVPDSGLAVAQPKARWIEWYVEIDHDTGAWTKRNFSGVEIESGQSDELITP